MMIDIYVSQKEETIWATVVLIFTESDKGSKLVQKIIQPLLQRIRRLQIRTKVTCKLALNQLPSRKITLLLLRLLRKKKGKLKLRFFFRTISSIAMFFSVESFMTKLTPMKHFIQG